MLLFKVLVEKIPSFPASNCVTFYLLIFAVAVDVSTTSKAIVGVARL